MLNFFEDINLQTKKEISDAPKNDEKVEELRKSDLVIKAYDSSTRSVEGTFVAPVKTGPIEAVVEFTVLDIPITYALLLGRP